MLDETLEEILDDFFLLLHTSIQYQPSNIHEFPLTNSIYNSKLEMEAEQTLMLVMLPELINSDDKKPTREKNRLW